MVLQDITRSCEEEEGEEEEEDEEKEEDGEVSQVMASQEEEGQDTEVRYPRLGTKVSQAILNSFKVCSVADF